MLLSLIACGPSTGQHGGSGSGGDESGGSESGDEDGGSESGGGEFRIRDQSGAQFGWECIETADGIDCDVLRLDVSPPSPCNDSGDFGAMLGRFITIAGKCPLPSGMGYAILQSRVLVCEDDADCPDTLDEDWTYECRAGLCQHTDIATWGSGLPTWVDAFTLCKGDEPRSADDDVDGPPQDPIDVLLDAACSDQEYPFEPCESLPAECIDPSS